MKTLSTTAVLLVSAACASAPLAQTRSLPDFTQIADSQGAAVVNVSTTQARARREGVAPPQGGPQLDPDDPFYEFFRRFIPRGPQGPREFESASLGSGFVVS